MQRWANDLYDAGVWSADHWVGVVLDRLAELELDEETIVVVVSDHGEELFEHGLFTHAHGLTRELVRVPLILAGPDIPAGERRTGLCSTNALGATLLRRLGLEPGPQWPAADLFEGEPPAVWFSTRQGWWKGRANQPLFGLRSGALTCVLAPTGEPWGGGASGDATFFDLARDSAEREDLALRDHPDLAALRARLEARLATLGLERLDPLDTPDEATLDMLRDIGYLGR
jgi:arylsulfatase A-like enzyme